MKKYTVFYGDILFGQYDHIKDAAIDVPYEAAPDCIIYITTTSAWVNQGWYKWDLTPILDADVPPVLKMSLLLLE